MPLSPQRGRNRGINSGAGIALSPLMQVTFGVGELLPVRPRLDTIYIALKGRDFPLDLGLLSCLSLREFVHVEQLSFDSLLVLGGFLELVLVLCERAYLVPRLCERPPSVFLEIPLLLRDLVH